GEFRNRTLESGISASLYLEKGEVVSLLNQRAQWNDLLVFSLEHPPQDSPASRLRSNLHGLIHDCPRPLLAVRSPSPMTHALLAFDGSPKAIEAMYLAVYLVEKWGIKLTVATALEDSTSEFNPLDLAREYLDSREIQATLISDTGLPSDVIITAMKNEGCDFIIVGGYGHQPVIEVFLGSTLNGLLRKSEKPILICH
ncbi:MAG: universal stress protein, partial [Anaerolineales bacterium]|nr:universal stress protein [Anaerolineales bacterium]